LRLAADLRGQPAAEFIQLYIAYAPEPPFNSGTPETAPVAVLEAARRASEDLAGRRLATAKRIGATLGIPAPSEVRE
jgi:cyclohexyl-isocyanide hydratase